VATLTVQTAAITGLTPAFAAVNASDQFPNTGKEILHVKNDSGGSIYVTITSQKACDQGSTHNLVVAVPAGEERKIGPFPVERFNHADTGRVTVAYSAQTSVTAGVFKNS
jgi:hypothetical protein